MCGIFGAINSKRIDKKRINSIVNHSEQRGLDSSGLVFYDDNIYNVRRSDNRISKLIKKINPYKTNILFGHSRLITNGLGDNQPVVCNGICLIHNGIIVNEEEIWSKIDVKRNFMIDSETISALAVKHLSLNNSLDTLPDYVLSNCNGIVACAMLIPAKGKLLLFSNNGSLYTGNFGDTIYFASESYALVEIGCSNVKQLIGSEYRIIDVPVSNKDFNIHDFKHRTEDLIPEFKYSASEEKMLKYNKTYLKRCIRCILPETMPFIRFDEEGVCNYCDNYKLRNKPKPVSEILDLVEPYRRGGKDLDCIVPFSGGRDSCYGLHLIVNELKMKPLTYTYDWGMVTDLGRRNISRMCSQLGVENIIIAADISKKRKNIRKNLLAWLKSPHLGMMALLTAGDKHFFRYVEHVKKQTGIDLNLWGINPLEVTHFKTGFLGIEPDFHERKVYSNGIFKQLRYHSKRFKEFVNNPGYINSSIWDTLSGEYYRSFTEKKDYFHIFDYWRWDENNVNDCLLNEYNWEKAIDTPTTWRIGDGTAAFYNYVYYTVAGFTEHDTFRSNQIREGQITREEALKLVEEENKPRYQNIRWYLDTLNIDYESTIEIVNNIPNKYNK